MYSIKCIISTPDIRNYEMIRVVEHEVVCHLFIRTRDNYKNFIKLLTFSQSWYRIENRYRFLSDYTHKKGERYLCRSVTDSAHGRTRHATNAPEWRIS